MFSPCMSHVVVVFLYFLLRRDSHVCGVSVLNVMKRFTLPGVSSCVVKF